MEEITVDSVPIPEKSPDQVPYDSESDDEAKAFEGIRGIKARIDQQNREIQEAAVEEGADGEDFMAGSKKQIDSWGKKVLIENIEKVESSIKSSLVEYKDLNKSKETA